VADADLTRAVEIAAAFYKRLRTPASDADMWQCGSCDEQVDGHFEVCWNCGRER